MAFSLSGIRSWWSRRAPRAQRASKAKKRTRGGKASRAAGVQVGAADDSLRTAASAGHERSSSDSAQPHVRSVRTYAREAAALLLLASSLYAGLALASYESDPAKPLVSGADWVGPVGAVFAGWAAQAVGVIAWLLPLELALVARPLLLDRRLHFGLLRLSGNVVLAVVAAAVVYIALPETLAFGALPVGGLVGQLFGEILRGLFSEIGSYLLGATVVALILLQRATFSFIDLIQRIESWLKGVRARADQGLGTVASAWSRAREVERQRREEQRRAAEPLIATAERADAIIAAFADDGEGGFGPMERSQQCEGAASRPSASPQQVDGASVDSAVVFEPTVTPSARTLPAPDLLGGAIHDQVTPSPSPTEGSVAAVGSVDESTAPAAELVEQAQTPPPDDAVAPTGGSPAAVELQPAKVAPSRRTRKKMPAGPRIVDTSGAARTDRSGRRRAHDTRSRFKLPTTDLLEPARDADVHVDHDALRKTAKLLEKTLMDYGVTGEVKEIHPGPTVTTFEVAPAPGTKVSKVAGLADDLALGLSRKVRIIAPIPGKNRVGFEVPNDRRIAVSLRELIEDRRFLEMKAPLPCVLGRDIIGAPVYADLSSMPHVIVAGATGAGKSVGLNVMLVSLLYRRTPDELRLLLIDPKVVELAPFDRIPHLLLPVVTDMKQAANALKWAVDEMERRYQLFANAGSRNIKSYNAWVKRVVTGKEPAPPGPKKVTAIAPDGTEVEVPAAKDGSDARLPELLPYIVVVVEEFADLMMQQGKDVEAAVARLAQKARAAGMHVILATQRPSVDVITGLIKANFPTRIAYRVAQKVDSRTILDDQGAEHLLGKGDMLVRLNGTNDSQRVQCPFCAEEEVQRVTDLLRAQGEPDYDESIVEARDAGDEPADPGDAESDPLYDQAVRIVAETRRCSTSWIQRKLGIGYNRAAKIVETMERNRIIGPPNGSKDREILVSPH